MIGKGQKKLGKSKHIGTTRRGPSPVDEHVSKLGAELFGLCYFAVKNQNVKKFPFPKYIRSLNTEATAIEQLIDNLGAQKNEKWYPFREAVAAVKLFSSVYYNLLHIHDALPRYRLLEIDGDFPFETTETLRLLRRAVISSAESMYRQAEKCGVVSEEPMLSLEPCLDDMPHLSLFADRKVRHVHKTGETVVYLSTVFLNLSEDTDVFNVLKRREEAEFRSSVPDAVNEENIRIVESRFHNLQSHYDTYIFETDIESQNRNLPVLRGHISIIYHLLQVATELSHFYERHMSTLRRKMKGDVNFPLTSDTLLSILFAYLLAYARRYLEAAGHLCRSMIKSYSEQREISVPIPNYRGFHVRPSTLIAKIVNHYGSSVKMVLNGKEYNAGVTLELFRANEEINATKRRYIGEVLRNLSGLRMAPPRSFDELKERLQILFLKLMNENEIILYDNKLSFHDLDPIESESVADLACRYIKHYMSTCKIDIKSKLTATFRGDSRALIDLKVLAENGYGEDKFGNNIVLPPELSYLRR